MKKNTIFLIGGFIVLMFALSRFRGCFGCNAPPKVGGKILVEKVTVVEEEKEGDWTGSEFDNIRDSIIADAVELQKERDHYFGRYQHYKKVAQELLESIEDRDKQIMAVLECTEKSRLQELQIADLGKQRDRDKALIEELFQEYDTKGERREYSGEVSGKHFKTQWKADVFGIIPTDGMKIKTDVTAITTTIEKPYEVWRKNTFGIFAGANTDINYLLGLGYERRTKWVGAFVEGEYYPKIKRGVGKIGGRVHF